MSKKVCMFVWNHFTNDARVLRECTALSDKGYTVDLIAIHDGNGDKLKKKEYKDGFNITRVNRYPKILVAFSNMIKSIKEKKSIKILAVAIICALVAINPLIAIILIGCVLGLANNKIRSFIIKVSIFSNMIYYGVKCNADIYHSNDLNTLPQGILCAKILNRKKLVYDSHEVQSSRTGYGKSTYYIEKILIKFTDIMIMTNKTRADYVEELYKIEKPKIVHNYPFYSGDDSIKNKYDLYEIANIPRDKPILLYQGGIQQGRGLEKIVEAIPYFEDGIVVFIGDGKLKSKIVEMVNDRKLNDKVRFIDKVPVEELKYYTANAYLGFQVLNNVCFNHYSACSNKLFEYIMSQVPVVACTFPEIERVVKDAKVGVCVDSHNELDIANGVNYLLNNKEYYNKFRENCISARETYNWNNEKHVFTKIYDDLTSIKYTKTLSKEVGA